MKKIERKKDLQIGHCYRTTQDYFKVDSIVNGEPYGSTYDIYEPTPVVVTHYPLSLYVEANVTFDLKISCLHNMSGTIRINGVADGYIRNTNGDIESGGNGYWNMGRGDSIELRYCEGNYYIISYVR